MHIHSCLSPCADVRMVPPDVVKRAVDMGLNMIAICDHNSCENASSFILAGKKENLMVLPGMEVCTKEEAHVLALFGDLRAALAMQQFVYDHLEGFNDEDTFGIQVVVDENGNPVGINERLLIGATTLSIESVVDAIHSYDGIAVASHVDRETFSVIGQLGFIPEGLRLDALELSRYVRGDDRKQWQKGYAEYPFLSSSDAHCLEEIGQSSTMLLLEKPTFEELRYALSSKDGREIMDRSD